MNWKAATITICVGSLLCSPSLLAAAQRSAHAYANLPKIAEVDPRFQSYNIEMVEVTGGRFWAPYGGPTDEMYRIRGPEDLSDWRLQALARNLGPAYIRVSGTWANSTYLEAEGEHLTTPPHGYKQVLTRAQWRSVIAFAKGANAKIGVSFAVGEGTRGPDGVWRSDQAQRLIELTRASGGEITWAEYINEPNAASLGSLPKDYTVADYTRDFRIFRDWAAHAAPTMTIVGPTGVGEGGDLSQIPVASRDKMLLTEGLMKANPGTVDIVSYHFYGDVSQRCASRRSTTASRADALTPGWLDLTLRDWRYYSGLRDKYEPGDPMWVTETAQAACGGSPWAASFVDTFRYVNQLGLLAQKGVKVVFHNTLGASDYSLIEQDTRVPRPNYWAAMLWRRTMGTSVLASPSSPSGDLRIYAHCLPNKSGGVGLAVINLGDTAMTLPAGRKARAWTMVASSLDSTTVTVNGRQPRLKNDGTFYGLAGAPISGQVVVPGRAITFLAEPSAGNQVCRI